MPTLTTTGHADINLVRTGPKGGPPLVFLHGLGLDLTSWDHQIPELGRTHDVVALDLPGHGLSAGLGSAPTLETLAGTVAAAIRHLDAGPVHLVGISLGGMIGQMVAVREPGLIQSLAFVATSSTFADPVRLAVRQRATLTRVEGMAAVAASHLQRWFSDDYRERRPDMLDRVYKVVLRQDAELHASLWDAVAEFDIQGLSALTCPVMVLTAESDPSASVAASRSIADQIAGAVLHVTARHRHRPGARPCRYRRQVQRDPSRAGPARRVGPNPPSRDVGRSALSKKHSRLRLTPISASSSRSRTTSQLCTGKSIASAQARSRRIMSPATTSAATGKKPAPLPCSTRQTPSRIQTGTLASQPSSGSSGGSTPATPKPAYGTSQPTPHAISQTDPSLPPGPPMPSVHTGPSRIPPTTAGTSPWARTPHVSDPTPVCSPGCAALPTTSSRQTRPGHFRRTDIAQPSAA